MHACRMRRRMVLYAVWMGLKDHPQRRHVCSNNRPWDNYGRSTSFAWRAACWPPHVMQCNDWLFEEINRLKNMCFLVYTYYTHCSCQISIFGKKLRIWYSNFYVSIHGIEMTGTSRSKRQLANKVKLGIMLIRDGPNVRLWHSAEAEGLGRLTERVPNVRPNFGRCCVLGWNNVFYWWAHWAARKCRS